MFDLSSAEPCAFEIVEGDLRLVMTRTAPSPPGRRWQWDLRCKDPNGREFLAGADYADTREACIAAANQRVDLILTKGGR